LADGEVRDGERAGACLKALIGRPLMVTEPNFGPTPGAFRPARAARAVRRRPARTSTAA